MKRPAYNANASGRDLAHAGWLGLPAFLYSAIAVANPENVNAIAASGTPAIANGWGSIGRA
jgi:hypothetical protein